MLGFFGLFIEKEDSNADVVTLGNYWGRDQAMVLYDAISISKVKVQPVSTLSFMPVKFNF